MIGYFQYNGVYDQSASSDVHGLMMQDLGLVASCIRPQHDRTQHLFLFLSLSVLPCLALPHLALPYHVLPLLASFRPWIVFFTRRHLIPCAPVLIFVLVMSRKGFKILTTDFRSFHLQWKMASAQSQMHEGVTSPPKGKSRIPILLWVLGLLDFSCRKCIWNKTRQDRTR